MSHKVYIVRGANLPPKVAIVDFFLPIATILEIENRHLVGCKYSEVYAVDQGVLQLGSPEHGPYDSAFLPGTDDYTATCSGSLRKDAGKIVEVEDASNTPRGVWELRHHDEDSRKYIVVTENHEALNAEVLAENLAQDFPKGQLEARRVLAGSYRLAETWAAPGFSVQYSKNVD